MKTIKIPELTLLALIGPSGAGKSTFAKKHFLPTEVLSSDYCRGLVSDDENDQTCSKDAFELLYYIAAKRLERGKSVVIDATNVRQEDRKGLIDLARRYHVRPSAIVFNLPEELFHERNAQRHDRDFGPHVIRNQTGAMRRGLRFLEKDGFRHVTVLNTEDEVNSATIERVKLWNNRQDEHGPFDIIGDIHGCYEELVALLTQLGYLIQGTPQEPLVTAPAGRKAVFLGDLVDRGPDTPSVLRLVMHMTATGCALCVPGNHDIKLARYLKGKKVSLTHGLEESVQQLEQCTDVFKQQVHDFLDGLVSHYVLDEGKLVVAHAGMKADMQGRASAIVRSFALYGETTGETDEFGLPERYDWARDYRGNAMVVYGHTPTHEAQWINRTICLDTGCVFGGKLTALRYPEKQLVSVDAAKMYCEPVRPLQGQTSPLNEARGNILDIQDVLGKIFIRPRLGNAIVIREEQSRAALEVMSRFALDPRWLIYLPATMAPSRTSDQENYLEHPAEALAYYREAGVNELVCEEKHMGSRAVIVLCRNEETATRRFGISDNGRGVIYTRTGRSFFNPESHMTEQVLDRLDLAMQKSGLWHSLNTDWIALDAEILPWSAKAGDLLKQQYASTGVAAQQMVMQLKTYLAQTNYTNDSLILHLHGLIDNRSQEIDLYIEEYQHYCWPVNSINDIRIAPFQILAYEKHAALIENHRWHLDTLDQLCAVDTKLLKPTGRYYVQLDNPESEQQATQWWHELTTSGRGEGMVVKPVQTIVTTNRGLLQPAVKCRGRNYLRIIYGPTYTETQNLERLRMRGLGKKYALALKEFLLGYEAIHRFVEHEPLYKVHECVFGVLALESEPVDPRL